MSSAFLDFLGRAMSAYLLAGTILGTGCAPAAPPDSEQAQSPLLTREEPPAAWQPLDPPAGPGSMAPHLAVAGEAILATWLEPEHAGEGAGGRHSLRFAALEGDTWSEAIKIASGSDFFVNWADFPAAARARDGSIVAHWLAKSGSGTYAYDIFLARSTDAGLTWSPLGKLNDDSAQAEHGFVSFVQEGDAIRAFWLDGREMSGSGEGHGGEGHGAGDMGLRTALITETIGPSTILDSRTCECCQTAAALTTRGPLVAYRDRSEGEIRDIAVVRREGDGWSEPLRVHDDGWEVPGCPVNGPALAASGNGVALAWYTAAGNEGQVLAAFSEDAGESFGAPVEIDGDAPMGRVDVDLLPGGDAVVTWLAASEEEGVIRVRRVGPGGSAGASIDLARTLKSRAAGFPRTAVTGSRIVVAWTGAETPSQVHAAWLDASRLPILPEGSERAPSGPAVGKGAPSTLPSLAVQDLKGRPRDLEELAGSPVLLNIWATWCAPCRAEMPDLARLHEEFSARGLKVVGLSLDASGAAEEIRRFVEQEAIRYEILHDTSGKAAALFGAATLPVSFLYDSEGRLIWKRHGPLTADDKNFRDSIETSLVSKQR